MLDLAGSGIGVFDWLKYINPSIGPFGRLTTRQVPCQWAGWCDWSPCGATCGAEAVKSRTRDCACGPDIDPTSRGCVGDDHQVEPCGPEECPEALPKGK